MGVSKGTISVGEGNFTGAILQEKFYIEGDKGIS